MECKLNFKAYIKNLKNLTPPKYRKIIKELLNIYRRAKNWIYFSILKKEISKEEIIDETLFFYPLVGMIKELTDAICDKNLKNLT